MDIEQSDECIFLTNQNIKYYTIYLYYITLGIKQILFQNFDLMVFIFNFFFLIVSVRINKIAVNIQMYLLQV